MGAVIDYLRCVMQTRNGGVKQIGQMLTPVTSIDTGTNDGCTLDDSVVIPAAGTQTIWEYGVHSTDWAFAMVEFGGSSGTIYLTVYNDTAFADGSPTGSAETKNREVLVNNGSRIWGTRDCLTNTSTADHAGSGANEVSGKITRIDAYNPSTSAIRLRRVILG